MIGLRKRPLHRRRNDKSALRAAASVRRERIEGHKTRTLVKIALAGFALYLAMYYWPPVAGFLGVALSPSWPLLLGLALAYPLNYS